MAAINSGMFASPTGWPKWQNGSPHSANLTASDPGSPNQFSARRIRCDGVEIDLVAHDKAAAAAFLPTLLLPAHRPATARGRLGRAPPARRIVGQRSPHVDPPSPDSRSIKLHRRNPTLRSCVVVATTGVAQPSLFLCTTLLDFADRRGPPRQHRADRFHGNMAFQKKNQATGFVILHTPSALFTDTPLQVTQRWMALPNRYQQSSDRRDLSASVRSTFIFSNARPG